MRKVAEAYAPATVMSPPETQAVNGVGETPTEIDDVNSEADGEEYAAEASASDIDDTDDEDEGEGEDSM